jgi:IS5 family transposase
VGRTEYSTIVFRAFHKPAFPPSTLVVVNLHAAIFTNWIPLRQMKRARACTRKLKTQLGRIIREIERQTEEPSMKLDKLLQTARRIYEQQRHDKNKIYSVHEPEVQCIAKGKSGKPYEFGNKVSVAVSSRGGWFVGAKSSTGNPYDGHTLAE